MAAAAGVAGRRASLGWVILAVGLAVPSVLVYNWWSHLKVEREKLVAAKARGRIPSGGIFQSARGASSKLVNPIASAPAAVSTNSVSAVVSRVSASSAVAAAPAPLAPAPIIAAASAVTALDAAAPAASTAAASSQGAGSAALPIPSLKRDPMLSPFDLIRLQEDEDRRRLAQERLMGERRPARRWSAETSVRLQGIVSSSESGSKAIVNNEVVGVGQWIGKVRVVRITDVSVTFEYKGRRFTKSVNRE